MTAMQAQSIGVQDDQKIPRPGVVQRLTQILDAFAGGPERLLLQDITSITGLPRSTAFRILSQLVDLQWLEHNARGYSLGPRVHSFGTWCSDHSHFRAAAANTLNELHLATGAVVHLTVLEGSTVHFLDKVGGSEAASVPSRVGSCLPADSTVSGRALLARLSPERVETLMSVDLGSRRRKNLAKLHTRLNQVGQRHGLAYAPRESCIHNIGAVAAPVLGPDGTVGAISVACRGAVSLDNIAPMVALAARRVSQLMFPNWSGHRPPARHDRVRQFTRPRCSTPDAEPLNRAADKSG